LQGAGRIALPSARANRALRPRYVAATEVPVEIRGAGQASRQVNNFCAPDVFGCHKLMAVEVLTPSGNWSSYPPHKHDTPNPGEAVLEEIYYFEVADQGIGYQRVYSSERGRIDTLAEVSSGDVVLVPYGYHGPSMAAPGYDLYYLNVLAGPAEQRSMAFCDDPRHAWIRSSWEGQLIDPRLPFGRTS
jgi:5-deoxy-glucuronate isomerase